MNREPTGRLRPVLESLSFQGREDVNDHDPPRRRHVVSGSVFGVGTTMSFTLAPSGAGTRVTMTANVQGRGLRRLLASVVTSEMRKSTVAALAALQAHLGAP